MDHLGIWKRSQERGVKKDSWGSTSAKIRNVRTEDIERAENDVKGLKTKGVQKTNKDSTRGGKSQHKKSCHARATAMFRHRGKREIRGRFSRECGEIQKD